MDSAMIEEKKKRETAGAAPSSVSGGLIASPKASIPGNPARTAQGIAGDLSVGGSRPAIYDGQPATGNIYASAGGGSESLIARQKEHTPGLLSSAREWANSGVPLGDFVRGGGIAAKNGIYGPPADLATPQKAAVKQDAATNVPAVPAAASSATSSPAEAATPADELHDRSKAHQALVSFGQRQAAGRGVSVPTAIANDAGVRNTFNAAHEAMGTGIMYGAATGADGKPQMEIAGTAPTKAQYIDANGQPTNDWTKTAQYAQGVATAEKMKSAAAQIPEQQGPKVAMIGDSGPAETQALFDKRAMQDMLAKAGPRKAAAIAALMGGNVQAETARRGQDIQRRAQEGTLAAGERDAMTRERSATADANLKAAQSQGIMADAESRLELLSLQQRAAKGDKAALDTLMALRGRGENYKDRYITLPNRKVYNEMGQITGEESGGIFDAATGQPVQQVGNGQGGDKPSAPAEALAFLKKNPSQAAAFKAKYGYLPDGF